MAKSVLDRVKAGERLITSQHRLGRYSLEEASERHVHVLCNEIRKAETIDFTELAELNEYLLVERGTFSEVERRRLSEVAEARADVLNVAAGDDGDAAGDNDSQSHMFLHFCYPDWLWAIIR